MRKHISAALGFRRAVESPSQPPGMLFFSVLSGALVLAFAAGGAQATTQPSSTVTIEVVATGHALLVGEYDNSADHDGLIPLAGPIRRGDFLDFQVINHTSKSGVFSAFKKKTKPIAPGKVGHFDALALHRGVFPYTLVLSGGTTLSGKLDVT